MLTTYADGGMKVPLMVIEGAVFVVPKRCSKLRIAMFNYVHSPTRYSSHYIHQYPKAGPTIINFPK
jgi:hypothetical protein